MTTQEFFRREFLGIAAMRRGIHVYPQKPLTETVLLGLVSLRADQQKLRWGRESGTVTNVSDANQYLARQNPREPWALDGAQETVEVEVN
jgi:hypothetical protein